MNIKIITIGKLKEKFWQAAIDEYKKRISRFAKIEIIELPEEKLPENSSEKENQICIQKEGQKILSKIKDTDFVIALTPEVKEKTSEEFANLFAQKTLSGYNSFSFIIGGSLGLSDEVKSKSDFNLSFSKMTFPHQLFRIMLIEQIYRAFKINANETYHK